jgi:mannose-6-phosphate isomerase
MRIAILAPIARRIPPRPYGPEEQMISDLAEGLLERGCQVTLFATANSLTRAELVSVIPRPLIECEEEPRPDPRWLEELHIGECMSLAARGYFDIILNFMSSKVLPFAATVNIPVLTMLLGSARDIQIHPVLRRYNEYPFVTMDEKEKSFLPELNYVATISIPSPENASTVRPVIDSYYELCEKLVSGEIETPVSELKRMTPWGSWEVLKNEMHLKVKKITMNPGQRLSYQRHQKREEHWFIAEGEALVVLDDKEVPLTAGQAIDIPKGAAHRIGNPGEKAMVFIEVQRGEYFGEDDIERLDDDYGRS